MKKENIGSRRILDAVNEHQHSRLHQQAIAVIDYTRDNKKYIQKFPQS